MLGCQVTQTCLSLIAHTWPVFDQSRSCTPCEHPVIKKTGFGMTDQSSNFNVICNVRGVKRSTSLLNEI